jgi:hypothetical protein
VAASSSSGCAFPPGALGLALRNGERERLRLLAQHGRNVLRSSAELLLPRGGRTTGRRYNSWPGRAKRGASGSLNPQSALAGPNSFPRGLCFEVGLAYASDDGQVPRTGSLRTASGPGGSSAKQSLSGAAGRPGPSERRTAPPRARPRRKVRDRVFLFECRDRVTALYRKYRPQDFDDVHHGGTPGSPVRPLLRQP